MNAKDVRCNLFFCGTLIVSVALCSLSNKASQSEENAKNDLLESMELQKVVDNLTPKDIFPSSPPYPYGNDLRKLSEFVDANLQQLNKCWFRLTFVKIDEEKSFIGKNTDQIRKDKCEAFLALSKVVHDLTNPDYVAQPMSMNIFPKPDESDQAYQVLLPNMPPNDIRNPKTRQKYEEALWNNSKNIFEYNIQREVSDLQPKNQRVFLRYVMKEYSSKPSAAHELVALLEKYEYPMEQRVKLLSDLEIPYKGFRNWQTKDGLFKASAKYVSSDGKDVTLEKPDGKQTTIELPALRKADQDYVREQRETPKP